MGSCETNTIVVIILVMTIAVAFMYYLHTKQFIKNSNYNEKIKIIKILTRQTARWALAAEQDNSPLIAVLHANYAAGYLWAIQDISTAQEVKAATGIEFSQLRDEVVRIQDSVTKKMALACPNYTLKNSKLSEIAKE